MTLYILVLGGGRKLIETKFKLWIEWTSFKLNCFLPPKKSFTKPMFFLKSLVWENLSY